MPADDSEPLADALVAQLAAFDDRLAGVARAAGDDNPYAAGTDPQLKPLQKCIARLRLVFPARAASLPGDLAALPTSLGRFRIRGELGRGGFGIVYLAEDPRLGRLVALKVPRTEALVGESLRQRFLREARAAASLDHPNVVPVYEAGEVGTVCYIASAYCPGPNLAAWLKEQDDPVAPRRAAALVAALADAVDHAHRRGVLHRDLKPANVLLAPAPVADAPGSPPELPFVPKLTDFGLAKLLEAEADQTSSGVLLGTPPYMAPEQAEGWANAVGAPTDVYALGVILYEQLTRRVPFLGPSVLQTLEQVREGRVESPSRLRPDVPPDLETVCLRCLRREPRDRYPTAGDLREDLRRYLNGEPVQTRPVGWWDRVRDWCRRPERIGNARFAATVVTIVQSTGSLVGISLMLAEILPVANKVLAFLSLTILLLASLPNSWIVSRTNRQCLPAIWAGVFAPILHPTSGLLIAFNVLPNEGLSNTGDLSMALAHLTLVVLVSSVQIAAYILALIAYYANRHVPGFVPAKAATSPVT
jgi:serine/threonine protein kinase